MSGPGEDAGTEAGEDAGTEAGAGAEAGAEAEPGAVAETETGAGAETEPETGERARWRPAAWRRPGAVALYFAYRAVAALLIAAPVTALVGEAVGAYPAGDAVLFEPGALMLLEIARLARIAAPALAAQIGAGALIAAALGLIPLAALLVALGRPGPLGAALVGARVARSLGPLVMLWGVAALAEVAAAGLLALLGSKLVAALALSRRADDVARAVVILAALLAAGAVAVVHDLGRIAVVHEERGFYAAAVRALAVARAAPAGAVWACAWRASLGLAAIAGAGWAAGALGVSTGGRVALAFVVHHAGLAAAAFLRASWLAAAIRLLDRTAPER